MRIVQVRKNMQHLSICWLCDGGEVCWEFVAWMGGGGENDTTPWSGQSEVAPPVRVHTPKRVGNLD